MPFFQMYSEPSLSSCHEGRVSCRTFASVPSDFSFSTLPSVSLQTPLSIYRRIEVKLPDGFSAVFADFSCFSSLSSYVDIIENIHASEACTLAPLPSGVHTQATHMYHQYVLKHTSTSALSMLGS